MKQQNLNSIFDPYDNKVEVENKARLTARNRCHFSLQNILKLSLISKTNKLNI